MAHPKGVLIERLQEDGKQPKFVTTSRGPDHAPDFESEVAVDGEILGRGQGGTKRTAERKAAEEALAYLDTVTVSKKTKAKASANRKRATSKTASKTKAKAAASTPKKAAETTVGTAKSTQPTTLVDDRAETSFDGPWPVFEELLATSLQIAHERVASEMQGDNARSAIETFALELYKSVLLDLGDVVNEDA